MTSLICPNCKSFISEFSMKEKNYLICNSCKENYFIIEGVKFLLTEKSDFYKYRQKLKRFVEFKETDDE